MCPPGQCRVKEGKGSHKQELAREWVHVARIVSHPKHPNLGLSNHPNFPMSLRLFLQTIRDNHGPVKW